MNQSSKATAQSTNTIVALGPNSMTTVDFLLRSSNNAAAMECCEIVPGGLWELGVNMSDDEWRAAHPDQPDEHGVLQRVPRPKFEKAAPVPPGLPAAQQTYAIHMATNQDKIAECYAAGLRRYRANLIESVGEVVCNELQHAEYGLARVQCHEIITHVKNRFANPTESDIAQIYIALRTWPIGLTYAEKTVRDKVGHSKLESLGQKMSEYAKMEHHDASCQGHSEHLRHIAQYKETVDHKVADRTHAHAQVTTYVQERTRDYDLSPAADYQSDQSAHGAHAANGRPKFTWEHQSNPPDRKTAYAARTEPDHVISLLTKSYDKLAIQMKESTQQMKAMAKILRVPLSTALDSDDDEGDRLYCFSHGFDKHMGATCIYMAKNSQFTDLMKAAKAPCVIDNVQGSTTNE